MEHIEKSAGTKRMGESLGSGFHGSPRYPSRGRVSTVFGKALLFSTICIAFVMVFEKYSESVKTIEIGVKPPFPTIVRFLSRYSRVSRPGWIARIASFSGPGLPLRPESQVSKSTFSDPLVAFSIDSKTETLMIRANHRV
jgi:hypothetical protein